MSKVISCLAFIPFFIGSCIGIGANYPAPTSCEERCDQISMFPVKTFYQDLSGTFSDGTSRRNLCIQYQSTVYFEGTSPCDDTVWWYVFGLWQQDDSEMPDEAEFLSLVQSFNFRDGLGNGGLSNKIDIEHGGGINGIAIKLRGNKGQERLIELCITDIFVDIVDSALGTMRATSDRSDFSNLIRLMYSGSTKVNCDNNQDFQYGLPLIDRTKLQRVRDEPDAARIMEELSDDGSLKSMPNNANSAEWALIGAASMLAFIAILVGCYFIAKKFIICHKIEVEIASDALDEELSENDDFDKEQQAITGIMMPQDHDVDDDAEQMVTRE